MHRWRRLLYARTWGRPVVRFWFATLCVGLAGPADRQDGRLRPRTRAASFGAATAASEASAAPVSNAESSIDLVAGSLTRPCNVSASTSRDTRNIEQRADEQPQPAVISEQHTNTDPDQRQEASTNASASTATIAATDEQRSEDPPRPW